MNIVLIGAAGAGKGTLAGEILASYHIPHISTGDMFRDQIARKTPLGLQAKVYMEKGELVPDEITIDFVRERLLRDDCRNGYLLDGFPRTKAQAVAFQAMLEVTHLDLDVVFYLDVEFDRLIRRITGRRVCINCKSVYHVEFSPSIVPNVCDKCSGRLYQRTDDTEESLRIRLQSFLEDTKPVLEYFEKMNLVKRIDANRSMAEVVESVKQYLEEIQ